MKINKECMEPELTKEEEDILFSALDLLKNFSNFFETETTEEEKEAFSFFVIPSCHDAVSHLENFIGNLGIPFDGEGNFLRRE